MKQLRAYAAPCFCLLQESSRFERALQLLRHLLWEHELWVAGKASRGPIEYVALRREPGPVCFKAATEIKTTEGQLIAAIPQVVSEVRNGRWLHKCCSSGGAFLNLQTGRAVHCILDIGFSEVALLPLLQSAYLQIRASESTPSFPSHPA